MTNEAKKTLRLLLEGIDMLDKRWRSQEEYTRFLQELAAEAKRTGKSLSHRIPEAPKVFDAGDACLKLRQGLKREGMQELRELCND